MISTICRWADESWSPIRFVGKNVLEPVFHEAAPHLLVEPAAVEEAEPFRQLADPDVFGDVDARDDLRLLVDDADPGFVRVAGLGNDSRRPSRVRVPASG